MIIDKVEECQWSLSPFANMSQTQCYEHWAYM